MLRRAPAEEGVPPRAAPAEAPGTVFTDHHRALSLQRGRRQASKQAGLHGRTAMCRGQVMRDGQHSCDFTIVKGRKIVVGVCQAGYNPAAGPPPTHSPAGWGFHALGGDLCHALVAGERAWPKWAGQSGVAPGDKLGLRLDLTRGSLDVYKNDQRLGTMVRRELLGQELCWMVEIENPGDAVVIGAAPGGAAPAIPPVRRREAPAGGRGMRNAAARHAQARRQAPPRGDGSRMPRRELAPGTTAARPLALSPSLERRRPWDREGPGPGRGAEPEPEPEPEPAAAASPPTLAEALADAHPQFVCPITGELMQDPVVDLQGHSYERSAVLRWLELSATSPLTRSPLRPADLSTNEAMRTAIASSQAEMSTSSTGGSAAPAAGEGGGGAGEGAAEEGVPPEPTAPAAPAPGHGSSGAGSGARAGAGARGGQS